MKISVFLEHIFDAAEQEKLSVEELLNTAKELGIDGVEVDYGRISADSSLIPLIKNTGLEISCVYAFFDFAHSGDMSYAEEVVKTLSGYGIGRLMAIPGFINKDDDYETCLNSMLLCMNRLSGIAQENGISLCLEDFDDDKAIFSTAKGLLLFIENVNRLECAFDTGNFIYSEESEEEAFLLLKNHITHLHCKDRCLNKKDGEEPKLTIGGRALYSSPVGYGAIGIEKIVKELLKSGYDGWFAIEHFGSIRQLSDMKKSTAKLKEWYNDTCNCME